MSTREFQLPSQRFQHGTGQGVRRDSVASLGPPVTHRVALRLGAIGLIAVAAAACHDATAPQDPPVWLAGNGPAQVSQKTSVCHAAGQAGAPKFVEISVNGNALSAHLGDNGAPVAGHEGDYLVTARTPCPPPATPPNVRVCKAVDANMPAGRTVAFDVNGESITLTGGGCADRTFRVGTPVTISESATAGTALDAINIAPVGAGSANVAGATATVVAGIDVAQVTFTNRALLGQMTLCKEFVPPGLDPGQRFEFYVTSTVSLSGVYYIIAGPMAGPLLRCVPAGTYPVGTRVGVWEEFTSNPYYFGIRNTSISVSPSDRLVEGSLDLETRRVQVTIGEGTTQVTYVNDRPVGTLRICKNSPPGSTGNVTFLIDAPWQDGTATLTVPVNGCKDYTAGFGFGGSGLGVPIGATAWIRETIPAGQSIASVTVDPPDRLVGANVSNGWSFVRMGAGLTTVTYQNVVTP